MEDDLAALESLAAAAPGAAAEGASAPAAKRPRSAGSSAAVDLEREPLSGLRIDLNPRTRRLSRADVAALASSFAVRRLHEVPALMRGGAATAPAAWLTIGCLIDRGAAKPTARGDSFCVWKLCDLRSGNSATTVSVFLFGEAFKEAWKELPGSVFALLTPRIVPPKDGASPDSTALAVEKKQQLQRIGQACDFGLCRGERKDGRPCTMWVNRAECEYCEYHAAAALRQLERAKHATAAKPAGTNATGSSAQRMPQGVTALPGAIPGLALPSGAAPVDAGVPRGLANQPRPGWSQANVSSAALAQQAQAKAVLESYGYKVTAPDPNSARPTFSSSSKPPPPRSTSHPPSALQAAQLPRGVTASAKPSVKPPSKSAAAPQRAASDFTKAFGKVDAASGEGKRVLGARPTHAAAELEGVRDGLNKRIDVLVKKDALDQKASQATVVEVTAHRCEQCNYLAEYQGSECKALGHRTTLIPKTKKRGFKCAKCGNHTTALNKRWPSEACSRCKDPKGGWKDAGVRREKSSAPAPASEFLARGVEHGRFRNSSGGPDQAELMRPEAAAHSAPAAASNLHNAWQGTLPTFDDH